MCERISEIESDAFFMIHLINTGEEPTICRIFTETGYYVVNKADMVTIPTELRI